jgi:phage shock protein E
MRKSIKMTSAIVAALLLVGAMAGCASTSMDVKKFSAIIDVRTPLEYSQGHLQGAVNVDVEDANFLAKISSFSKAGAYVIYCHSGRRAGIAIEEMTQNGFTGQLVNAGGYAEASTSTGLPIVTN